MHRIPLWGWLGLLTAFSSLSPAADWPQWRGPERTGFLASPPALPTQFPGSLPQVWRQPAGEGFASPVVAGGKVFLFDNQGGQETLRALAAADGQELWRTTIDETFKDSQGPPGPRCTPVVEGDRVYAQSCRGELQCLAVADGRKLWRVNFGRDFGAVFVGEKGNAPGATRHGNNGSPLVSGDWLYASVGSTNGAAMVAFDKRTGAVKWKAGHEIAAYAAPVISHSWNPNQVVNFMADAALGFDAATGRPLWRFPLKTAFARHVMTPILDEPAQMVLIGSHQTGLFGLRLIPEGDGFKVEEAWKQTAASPNFSSGFLREGFYYGLGPTRNLVCVDVATGAVRWSNESWVSTPADKAHASFVFDRQRCVALLDDGQLILWEPRPEAYRELSRVQACAVNWCQPAIADGRIYVRDGLKGPGQLTCLELGK